MDKIIDWIYNELKSNMISLKIRFVELIEKDDINFDDGIHLITNENKEYFITDSILTYTNSTIEESLRCKFSWKDCDNSYSSVCSYCERNDISKQKTDDYYKRH